MRARFGIAAAVVVGCGGAAGEPAPSEAESVIRVDAGPNAPAWCTPLEPYQTSCKIDPMVACESHNGVRPSSAYLCGGWANPSGCVGFTPDNCTVMAFCCE